MKKYLVIVAIICFIFSAIMVFKGYNKMTEYHNSSYKVENAYVGGDAYNFIINGTYATSFFVLAAGAFLSGTVCCCSYLIIESLEKKDSSQTGKVRSEGELPPL